MQKELYKIINEKKYPWFRSSCSCTHLIMANAKGNITEKQLEKLAELQNKDKRTEKQQKELDTLIHKRDNPELSETAKTYCKDWLKNFLFGRRKEFSSKQTEKGTTVEQESIDFLVDNGFLFAAEKNKERRWNDYIEGECDLNQPDEIIDVKNSWTMDTFPIFETKNPNKGYDWQLDGYMDLWYKDKSRLIYILTNTPLHLIEKEVYYATKDVTDEKTYKEIEAKILKNHIFDDLDPEDRVKFFHHKKDPKRIKAIKERVAVCQLYICELYDQYLIEKEEKKAMLL